MSRLLVLAAALGLGLLLAVGAGAARGPIRLGADRGGELRFDVKTLSAKPGKVTLVLANPSPLPHSIAVRGNGLRAAGKIVGHGGTSTVTATLRPGRYTFYCTVPGHEQAGMRGVLVVR